jgi:hypothetical protein
METMINQYDENNARSSNGSGVTGGDDEFRCAIEQILAAELARTSKSQSYGAQHQSITTR